MSTATVVGAALLTLAASLAGFWFGRRGAKSLPTKKPLSMEERVRAAKAARLREAQTMERIEGWLGRAESATNRRGEWRR